MVVKFFNQLKAYRSMVEGAEQSPMGGDIHQSPRLKRQLGESDEEGRKWRRGGMEKRRGSKRKDELKQKEGGRKKEGNLEGEGAR